nr:hypothetical protein [Tanacetum cinerariifolium]
MPFELMCNASEFAIGAVLGERQDKHFRPINYVTYVPAGSRNSSASTSVSRSIPAASRNRPASIHAGRHIPAGRFNKLAPFPAGRSVPTGWTNHAAFRPTNLYFDNVHPHVNKNIGIVDSGCSRSMIGSKEKLDDFVQIKEGIVTFRGGDDKITRKGIIRTSKLNFENVYYMEELQHFNLFFVSQICDKMNKVLFTNDECIVLTKEFKLPDESQVVLRIPRRHDLYTFNLFDIQPEQPINYLLAKASFEESTKWHRRMAHVNIKTINKLAKNELVEGLPLKIFANEHKYVACNKGKQHKASYKAISAVRTISEPLQLLHMDFLVLFLSEVLIKNITLWWSLMTLAENQLNKKVKAIRYDNGTKFQNLKLIDLCGEKGIKRDYSNARTPQQNGVAERKNRTLIEAARSMLADSKLPTMFWTEAVSTACYFLNRVSITNPNNKIPYELLSRKVPNIRHLKPFGCQVTILNTSDHLGNFKRKANVGFLVGYAANSKAYRVYHLSSKRLYHFKTNTPAGTQDTTINAGTEDDDSKSKCDEQAILVPSFPSNTFSGHKVNDISAPIENNLDYAEELARLQKQEHEAHSAAAKYGFEFSNRTAEMLHQAEIETRRNLVLAAGDLAGSIVSTCEVPAGSVLASYIIDSAGFGDPAASESVPAVFNPDHAADSTLPPSSSVAVDPVATKRVNTINPQSQIIGELQSPVQTRSTVQKSKFEPSSVAKALEDPDWVAAMQEEMQQFYNKQNKRDARGIVVRNKAILVAQGHRQVEGIDYYEVFAPAARIEAIRLFLAFASYIGFMVYQMDVKSAFLYGEIEEEVYVTQPKRFEDPYNPTHVYRVIKALNGLHQAPRAWQVEGIDYDEVFAPAARIEAIRLFLAFASYMGFMVYQMDVKSAFLYGEIEEEVRGTIDKTLFIKKDSMHIILVQVYVDDIIFGSMNTAWCDEFEVLMKGEFEMSAMDMLKKFDMESVRTVTTPYEVPKHKLNDKPDDAVNVHLYSSMIGFLMYLTASRPDIMFALEAYSDSDYAGSPGDRNSKTGGCQFLGRRLISWQCKKQTVVATSSSEAKYVAAASCCGQISLSGSLHCNAQSLGTRPPMLLVVPVFLLVVLVHVDEWFPTGSCTIPTGSYSFMLMDGFLLVVALFLLVVPRACCWIGSYWLAALLYKDDHNKVAYLEKGKGWEAYEQIWTFLIGHTSGIQTTDPSPRPTFDFTANLFSNLKLNWDGLHMPLLAPMLVVPVGGDGADTAVAGAAAATKVSPPPPPPNVPPTHTSFSTPGPSHAAHDTPVREPPLVRELTPVREPTPSPVREPTTFREPTSDTPRPPYPRLEEVAPTTSTRPPSPTRQTSFQEDISEGGGDYVSSPKSNEAPPTTATTAAGGAEDSA